MPEEEPLYRINETVTGLTVGEDGFSVSAEIDRSLGMLRLTQDERRISITLNSFRALAEIAEYATRKKQAP